MFRGQPAFDGAFSQYIPCPPGVTFCIKVGGGLPILCSCVLPNMQAMIDNQLYYWRRDSLPCMLGTLVPIFPLSETTAMAKVSHPTLGHRPTCSTTSNPHNPRCHFCKRCQVSGLPVWDTGRAISSLAGGELLPTLNLLGSTVSNILGAQPLQSLQRAVNEDLVGTMVRDDTHRHRRGLLEFIMPNKARAVHAWRAAAQSEWRAGTHRGRR
jgi:hypothetical protein